MGFLVRVVRGNFDGAVRQLNRLSNADGQARLVKRTRNYVRPGEARRRARADAIRRIDRSALSANVRVVFNRMARGF